jgi:hypothetical protein
MEIDMDMGMDIVYAPNFYFGVLFAETSDAEHFGQIARAVRDSKTWGEFRAALPSGALFSLLENYDEESFKDDEPFPGGYEYGDDGWFLGGWPGKSELDWFPRDLIEKYGGEAEYSGPNYDNLRLPREAAEEIADELRTRGCTVEETLTGDLADWLELVMGSDWYSE